MCTYYSYLVPAVNESDDTEMVVGVQVGDKDSLQVLDPVIDRVGLIRRHPVSSKLTEHLTIGTFAGIQQECAVLWCLHNRSAH